jgi:hypothetical protein
MAVVDENDGVATLVFKADRTIPDDRLVEISEQTHFNPLVALSASQS